MSSFFDESSLVFIPSGYKTSKAYSVKPTDGTGDLAFTRSNDTATRVGPDGLIEKVRTNLFTYSQLFSNAAWSKTDSTFSVDTLTAGAGTTFKGTFQNQVTQGLQNVYFDVAYVSHQWLQIGFGTGATDVGYANFDIQNKVVGTSGGSFSGQIQDFGTYVRISLSINAVDKTSVFLIFVDSGSASRAAATTSTGAFKLFRSQLQVGDVPTDYIATTTAAVSVGPVANVPRLDYLNSSCPRLLLEPQRTNLVTYSEQMDNNVWNKSQSGTGVAPVVTANNAISPDGTQNADTVVFNSGAGTTSSDISSLFQTFGGTTATYTGSFYAKTASGTAQIQVRIDGSNYTVFTITNQWQRFTLTKALTGTSNVFEMAIRRGLNEPINATATIQLWGMQVELGAYATSYIPTLGASVTRGADAASKTGISSLIGQTEGTLFFEGVYGNEVEEIYLFLQNGSASGVDSSIYIQSQRVSNSILFRVWNASSLDVSIVGGTFTVGQSIKIAAAYKANDFVLYVNGVQIDADTSGAVPLCGRLQLGSYYADPTNNVYIARQANQALLFKTRLTNAQLAELTTI